MCVLILFLMQTRSGQRCKGDFLHWTAQVQIGWKRRLKEKQLGNGEGKKKKMRMEKETC